MGKSPEARKNPGVEGIVNLRRNEGIEKIMGQLRYLTNGVLVLRNPIEYCIMEDAELAGKVLENEELDEIDMLNTASLFFQTHTLLSGYVLKVSQTHRILYCCYFL